MDSNIEKNQALPFLTGNPLLNTKDTTDTKEKSHKNVDSFPFVYFVSFVFEIFPVKNERAKFINH